MILNRRMLGKLAASAGAFAVAHRSAFAQAWPAKQITMVQPFAAGGGMDPVARMIGNAMTEKFGQQIVMEYRTGAGGTIGTAYAAKQPADGYTLLINPGGPMTVAKHLYKDPGYETLRDFVPIIKIAETPFVIISNTKNLPMKTLKEFIVHAKANPEGVAVANVGNGTLSHLSAMLFERAVGIKMRHVPYRGAGQMFADMVSGQVDLTINFYAGFGPHVDKGTLRVLGVAADENIPDVLKPFPTAKQAGIPEMGLSGWYGLYAPRATPQDIVARIHATVDAYLRTDDARKRLGDLAYAPSPQNTEQLSKFIAEEDAKLGKLVRTIGLEAQ